MARKNVPVISHPQRQTRATVHHHTGVILHFQMSGSILRMSVGIPKRCVAIVDKKISVPLHDGIGIRDAQLF